MTENIVNIITEVSQVEVVVDGALVSTNQIEHLVSVISNQNEVTVSYGSPGPTGNTGEDGGVYTTTAGETIPGHRAVSIINNQAFLADPTNLSHGLATIGVVRDAASSGSTVNYRLIGELTGGSFSNPADYFIGALGTLVTSPVPIVGASWRKRVGTSISSSVLMVDMDDTVLL